MSQARHEPPSIESGASGLAEPSRPSRTRHGTDAVKGLEALVRLLARQTATEVLENLQTPINTETPAPNR